MPLKIADSLSFADVSEIFRETTFDSLALLFPSKSELEALKRVRYGLIREFECAEGDRHLEDEKSAQMLYCLYLGLKVVQPFSGRFQIFHYDLAQSMPRLPRGARNDFATILCDSERLNRIRPIDLDQLKAFAPLLLTVLKDGTLPVSQAMQSLEIGYRADFLNVRHLLWVVGLDALFTSTEWENQGAGLAARRIAHFLGSRFQISSPELFSDLGFSAPANPNLSDALHDIYKLRNHFAHGTWPEKRWAGTVWRQNVDFSRNVFYSEFLSEATSAILRGCLKKVFSDGSLVEMFNEKARMNAHFATILRKRKKKCSLPGQHQ
jgi:hypothetical protein